MRFTSQADWHHHGTLDQLALNPADPIQVGGSAVGLATHLTERMGSFVWVAEPIFD
jgi:hypothetical protein